MLDPNLIRRTSDRRRFLMASGGLVAAANIPGILTGDGAAEAASNPIAKGIVDWLLPKPLPYPPADLERISDEARRLSDAVMAHVEAYLDGKAPPQLPLVAVPRGVDVDERALRVSRPEELRPEDYWIVRPAQQRIDMARLRGLYPDPHCTYIIPGAFLAPFGTTARIEGDFPHSRFFSVQVTPPFDPRNYYYNGAFGVIEVPIVDVDVDPLPGHVNPFRRGAERNAGKRGYSIELEMREGDGVRMEPAFRPPHYRARGNHRFGGGMVYQGPFGRPGQKGGHGRGEWGLGAIWVRYYAPDRTAGPLAGVALPRLTQYLPDGRTFVISVDKTAKEKRLNKTFSAPRSKPAEPDPNTMGPAEGWTRETDIFHSGIVGIFRGVGKDTPADKAQGRALVKGVAARGEDLPAPNNWGSSTSRSDHIAYLVRGMALGNDRVIVLTGRLPTHPRTLDGQDKMTPGQVRYFSLTTYPEPELLNLDRIGVAVSSIMDEEIVTDAQGRYVICYSRERERPFNARAEAGVTWVDWGPAAKCGWTMRWLTVNPDHKDASITPDDAHISYGESSWLSPSYRPDIIGINGRSALMRDYVPRVHYLRRSEFESLGVRVDSLRVPIWT